MITIILIVASIAYTIELLLLWIGMIKADRLPTTDNSPSVSIIVAARDEEQTIGSCLESILKVEYPDEKLEIVIVDDSSSDRTAATASSFIGRRPNLKVISSDVGTKNLRGKANALAQGIAASKGEILMFTDADCLVPSKWVRETVRYFDEYTGIVGGFTVLEANRIFEGMQTLDWLFLFGLASATAGWGMPLTAIGNNLSVRRKAYEEIGGYEAVPFSVTEDYSLVQAILQRTRYLLRFPVNPHTVVTSRPCSNWKHLIRQKQRWGVGGLDMIWPGMLMTSIGWICKLALLVTAFMISFPVWLGALACSALAEVLFLSRPLHRFRKFKLLKYFLPFEIFFSLYVLIIPFFAYFSKEIVWKERQHPS